MAHSIVEAKPAQIPSDALKRTIAQGMAALPGPAGDALFVAAGKPHRFENFSGDFAVWVVFYGPEGGER